MTASRDLLDEHEPVLEQALTLVAGDVFGRHTLTHGGAKGGDTLLARIAHRLGWNVVKRRAYWSAACVPDCDHGPRPKNRYGPGTMCPAQGSYRNARMVAEGHDVCVAVFLAGARNSGTWDCSQRAETDGIPVRRFRVERDGSLTEFTPGMGGQLALGSVTP